MNYWLLKSEPSVFSIDDLARQGEAIWDGVRNYQARNHLRTAHIDDLAFFYHSSNDLTGIAGLCKVVAANIDDPTQFDSKSDYYDPKSTRAQPRWLHVDMSFVRKTRLLELSEMRSYKALTRMRVLQRGNRLSITPVTSAEWKFINGII